MYGTKNITIANVQQAKQTYQHKNIKEKVNKTKAPIHPFSSLSYDRSTASSKASSPHSAI